MEQRQLDEADDSFFGEEFIEDDDLLEGNSQNNSLEGAQNVKEARSKPKKKAARKTAKKSSESGKLKEDEIKIEPATEDKVGKLGTMEVESKEEDVKITSASEPEKPTTSTPTNPWADDDDEPGLFGEASTWKAITGIVVILLILSVFTQGFNFAENSQKSGELLSISEAEGKALNFVNSNLLSPPFVAEAVGAEDVDNLYKVTISVAGESVDSYITKDGKLFFPQGFDTSLEVIVDATDEVVLDTSEPELPVEDIPEPESPEEIIVEEIPEEPAQNVILSYINAKKWSFTPDKIVATQGDIVQINLNLDATNPAFALDEFTFSLPEYGIEQEVTGPTKIEFLADKTGEFEFACSSCKGTAAQVMTGTLKVKEG